MINDPFEWERLFSRRNAETNRVGWSDHLPNSEPKAVDVD